MTAAADTAADAPDVTSAGTLDSGTAEWTLDQAGGFTDRWFRAHLPAAGAEPYYRLVVTDPDLTVFKDFTVYTSTDEAEDGSTLTQILTGSDAAPAPPRVDARAASSVKWFYFQMTVVGPASSSGALHWVTAAGGPPVFATFASESSAVARVADARLVRPDPMRSRSAATIQPVRVGIGLGPFASRSGLRWALNPRPVRPVPLGSRGAARIGLSGTIALRADIQLPAVLARSIGLVPDLSQNEPVSLAMQLRATLAIGPPEPDPDLAGGLRERGLPITTFDLPTPAIIAGLPRLPPFLARSRTASTAIQGVHHLHSVADPDPVWDPRTGGWATPPPAAGVGDARWTVQTLPDPPEGGYYWLGEASSADGTAGIAAGARQWAADRSTPHAPSWHSFFPYKPSVRALDSFLPGGNVVHHPKGVHFNSQFVEHMWMDLGRDSRQPFSFVIAGMLVSFPYRSFTHYILGAGRNPDAVGFPRISDSATGTPRAIADGLAYDSMISAASTALNLASAVRPAPGRTVVCRLDAAVRPRMFFGIFNGSSSYVGAYDPSARRIQRGSIDHGAAQQHRYFVLGRRLGHIAQGYASHIMLFEIRYWSRALSTADLAAQYAQLSSTYKFNQYRRL